MACLKKRGRKYYAQYYVGRRQKRISLNTTSLQIAKEKLRQLESSLHRGEEVPLPTRTKIEDIVQRYAEHVRTVKTPKSAQTDIYYLRQMFGPISPALQINSRKRSVRAMKRPPIHSHVRSRGLAPKTANRYREIVHRLFSWAMAERSVKIPGGVNPASEQR